MKRKIYEKMLAWKQTSAGSSALMIDGARRVGKSWIAEEFAKNEYEGYLLIDFSKVPNDVKGFFRNYMEDLDSFFLYLLGAYHVNLKPRKSVIIFDEVQEFPRAREAIKWLVKDGRYDYIETGSLISIDKNVRHIVIPSEEHRLKMYPMDFEEFLWATGNAGFLPIIAKCYKDIVPVGVALHRRIMDVFRQYLVVGGMPQAVEKFVETHDLSTVDACKRDIIDLYRADILKHGGASKHKILAIFNSIPGMLSRHSQMFSPGEIKVGAGMRSFQAAFQWLESAMTVNLACNATEPNIGLELSADHAALKCYLADSGLMVSMSFGENELNVGDVQQRILTGRLEVNTGMLWETIVAQMLRACGHKLYFYARRDTTNADNTMEIDFLIAKSQLQRRHNISPIEVKGTGEYATKSLGKFIAKYEPFLNRACVLHTKDVVRADDRVYFPVYMAGLIQD